MSQQTTQALSVLDEASRMLKKVKSLDEIKSVRDRAEAARTFARAARMGLETQNRAAAIKLQAERKAGSFLSRLNLRGGDRRSKSKSHRATLKLDDLGITKDESRRWQLEASVPDEQFEQYISSSTQLGREVTAAGLLRLAKCRDNAPQVAARRRKPRKTCDTTTHAEPSEPARLIEEIESHHNLLIDLLRPVCTNDESKLKGGQRRHLIYLLSEIEDLLEQLGELVGSPQDQRESQPGSSLLSMPETFGSQR